MRKTRNVIIYIIVFIVIFISFKIPNILLDIENNNIEIEVYEKEKAKSKIDIKTENIYLVKAIHDIENEENTVDILPSETVMVSGADGVLLEAKNQNIDDFVKELLKLKEYDILDNIEINENTDVTVGMTDKSYQKDNSRYTINRLFLQINSNKYKLEIESKTGKILYILFDKGNLYNNSSKEEIMKNYIKYLDLHIIDDWILENNMLKSEKAELVVNLVETEENYILSIHSTGKIFNIYEYDDIIKQTDTK